MLKMSKKLERANSKLVSIIEKHYPLHQTNLQKATDAGDSQSHVLRDCFPCNLMNISIEWNWNCNWIERWRPTLKRAWSISGTSTTQRRRSKCLPVGTTAVATAAQVFWRTNRWRRWTTGRCSATPAIQLVSRQSPVSSTYSLQVLDNKPPNKKENINLNWNLEYCKEASLRLVSS